MHGIRTLLIGMKPPFVLVVKVFLFCQMEHPIVDKLLNLDDVQSFKYGILDLEGIGHEFQGTVSFCISSIIGEPDNVLCLLAFSHICVHELFLS